MQLHRDVVLGPGCSGIGSTTRASSTRNHNNAIIPRAPTTWTGWTQSACAALRMKSAASFVVASSGGSPRDPIGMIAPNNNTAPTSPTHPLVRAIAFQEPMAQRGTGEQPFVRLTEIGGGSRRCVEPPAQALMTARRWHGRNATALNVDSGRSGRRFA